MNKRKLGKNGPELTEIGFGAWAIGGGGFQYAWGWGPQDDQESIAALNRAIDLGINWVDTAAVYGLGHSEEIVGEALKDRRKEVIIATKCGRPWNEKGEIRFSLRPESILAEAEASLRRLGTDYIDLYQFHWPDSVTGTPIEDSWGEMQRLKEEGKVLYCGLSNFDVPLLERCEAIAHVDSLQPPYNMLQSEAEEELLPHCKNHGIGVVAYSPMASGLLTGKFDMSRLADDDWRRRSERFQEPQLAKNLAFVERLRPISEKYDKTVGQLAIAWVLANPAVTSAIVGARRPSQVEQNVEASGWNIGEEDMEAIRDELPKL